MSSSYNLNVNLDSKGKAGKGSVEKKKSPPPPPPPAPSSPPPSDKGTKQDRKNALSFWCGERYPNDTYIKEKPGIPRNPEYKPPGEFVWFDAYMSKILKLKEKKHIQTGKPGPNSSKKEDQNVFDDKKEIRPYGPYYPSCKPAGCNEGYERWEKKPSSVWGISYGGGKHSKGPNESYCIKMNQQVSDCRSFPIVNQAGINQNVDQIKRERATMKRTGKYLNDYYERCKKGVKWDDKNKQWKHLTGECECCDDVNKCYPTTCKCSNGTPVDNKYCPKKNQNKCKSCNKKYLLGRDAYWEDKDFKDHCVYDETEARERMKRNRVLYKRKYGDNNKDKSTKEDRRGADSFWCGERNPHDTYGRHWGQSWPGEGRRPDFENPGLYVWKDRTHYNLADNLYKSAPGKWDYSDTHRSRGKHGPNSTNEKDQNDFDEKTGKRPYGAYYPGCEPNGCVSGYERWEKPPSNIKGIAYGKGRYPNGPNESYCIRINPNANCKERPSVNQAGVNKVHLKERATMRRTGRYLEDYRKRCKQSWDKKLFYHTTAECRGCCTPMDKCIPDYKLHEGILQATGFPDNKTRYLSFGGQLEVNYGDSLGPKVGTTYVADNPKLPAIWDTNKNNAIKVTSNLHRDGSQIMAKINGKTKYLGLWTDGAASGGYKCEKESYKVARVGDMSLAKLKSLSDSRKAYREDISGGQWPVWGDTPSIIKWNHATSKLIHTITTNANYEKGKEVELDWMIPQDYKPKDSGAWFTGKYDSYPEGCATKSRPKVTWKRETYDASAWTKVDYWCRRRGNIKYSTYQGKKYPYARCSAPNKQHWGGDIYEDIVEQEGKTMPDKLYASWHRPWHWSEKKAPSQLKITMIKS